MPDWVSRKKLEDLIRMESGINTSSLKTAPKIELITAAEARDAMTTRYRQHLVAGDGPARLALFAPNIDLLARRLDEIGHRSRRPPRRA